MIAMTAGLHGSASTWVFNVARELASVAFGTDGVHADYLEDADQIPVGVLSSGRSLLVKSHYGSDSLDRWMTECGARIIVSVRDPRDATLSMMRRFGATADVAAGWLARDCGRILRLLDAGHPVFRYEDRFFDNAMSVPIVAERLGLAADPSAMPAIFARYRTDALRTTTVSAAGADPITQIWPNHIGDTLSGKWRSMPPPGRDALNRVLGPFIGGLGYPVA